MVTEPGASSTVSPIVVALSASRRCAGILETAAALAASVGADLEVVLVESADLSRLADLPVTRETDRVSGVTRNLDSARLKRALEGEARRLRQQLARIQRASSTRSTLRVVRGRMLIEALAASAGVDVTFVLDARRTLPCEGRSQTPPAQASPLAGSRPRGLQPRRKPVWILYEGDPGSARALRVAARLARLLTCSLVVMVPSRSAGQTEALTHEARSAIHDLDLRFVEVAGNGAFLQQSLPLGASSLLVLAKHSQALENEAMLDYLESLAVPLVLVT
ncbi:MAG: hypothetical protein GTO67_02745 [Gammaproteobacteria bacterium]|nr:hypothetical protein [Gammaproteobacteria bacterium]NIM72594.1 hypothetical protein [Gammaproteobacteria bacterium]NIN37651.1 hypothetical protein [Gammaproteobacteria bacterium]NIO24355.1 hypothetical protein [Gammaproteobacteria bacterium]NIO64958.1 hypothetical protein [Gammaproteobacteria bacterium]